ncbi:MULTISPECIES: DUF6794 domain-containing protein [Pseudoalteromonas]|uniref:DUF6794 domain-containing protein n=1 Tax=Pseudoalteromonas undina TaxID=43660 RepID=A0ACC6R465_9GAMM|nr:DUF6794 domain-containing protein [Pseudoalteromonas sp. P1-13-1a]
MKFLVASLLIFILVGCASKPTKEVEAINNSEIPQTCEGAIKKVAESLDDDSIKTLKETKKEDLIMFHMSWGMGIRNSYGLWSENSPIRKSCAKSIGEQDMHPDNASGIIMDGVWEIINGANM